MTLWKVGSTLGSYSDPDGDPWYGRVRNFAAKRRVRGSFEARKEESVTLSDVYSAYAHISPLATRVSGPVELCRYTTGTRLHNEQSPAREFRMVSLLAQSLCLNLC
jgi:hypothetical protein